MKLTTKHIMLILMCTLLVLVIVMGTIVLSRVSELFQLSAGPGDNTPDPVTSSSVVSEPPASSSVPPVTTQPLVTTAPHVHEYAKGKTIAATCDTQGFTLYNCSCGKSDIRDFKNPLGHNYGAKTVVPATCETDGWTERTCSRCKKTEVTEPTKAGHKFNTWAAITVDTGEPTQEKRTCSGCKMVEIRSLDTANTWVIRKSILEPDGVYTRYKLVVDLDNTDNDPTYELYIGLPNKNLGFDYDKAGLTISYIAVGEEESYKVPVSAKVLTIYADGKVTTAKPAATDDPTPSTGPATGSGSSTGSTQPDSQPTSQPDSQPASQPTSQPDSQPTSQPTSQPDSQPTSQPTSQPDSQPTSGPAAEEET